MKELKYLEIINNHLSDNSYLGDDCAYLDDLGIYVTQDSLVQDVHFSLSTTSAFELGQKAVGVNLSDLASCGAKPLYITISLSLPSDISNDFVKEFYKGVDLVCNRFGVKVAGGDLTGSDKVFISICAIGKKAFDVKASRSFAKTGDVVFVTGVHGDSAGGLKQLSANVFEGVLIKKHLTPMPQIKKSKAIMEAAEGSGRNFAMMDTSDGLADALYKVAKASGVTIEVDFEKIPVSDELKSAFSKDWKDLALWGGEDFELLGCLSKEVFQKLDKSEFFEIGRVKENGEAPVIISGSEKIIINEETFLKSSFNHFEEGKND